MLLRVRTNTGIWRVEIPNETTATIQTVLQQIQCVRPNVLYMKPLSLDPQCQIPIPDHISLYEQNIKHGSMIYCMVDPSTTIEISSSSTSPTAESTKENSASSTTTTTTTTSTNNSNTIMKRIIDKDGMIKLIPQHDTVQQQHRGFRKGMLALRDMKMHWTLSDFILLDSQYEFKIQRQSYSICAQVSLDIPSLSNYQTYLQKYITFQNKHIGYLYGKFIPLSDDESKNLKSSSESVSSNNNQQQQQQQPQQRMKCIVEAIYEPPQEINTTTIDGFILHHEEQHHQNELLNVNHIAQLLGLQRVGWIFGHELRHPNTNISSTTTTTTSDTNTNKNNGNNNNNNATDVPNYTLSSSEIIMMAEYQLEAADGIHETPFITITVSPTSSGTISVEAFQVSQQCMAMVAEEALEVDIHNLGVCKVNETFTAIQEGKASPTIDNSFFVTVVPIIQHTSDIFISEFPRMNRIYDIIQPSPESMKKHLSKSGTAGWTFIDRLCDFHLLLYLSQFLDINTDYPKICAAILDRHNVPLDDGYKLIIKSIAGMDGSY